MSSAITLINRYIELAASHMTAFDQPRLLLLLVVEIVLVGSMLTHQLVWAFKRLPPLVWRIVVFAVLVTLRAGAEKIVLWVIRLVVLGG